MIEGALRTWMQTRPAVTAIVGDGSDDQHPFRWYGVVAPQNAVFPLVAFETLSVDREDALDQGGPSNHCNRSMSIRCYDKTYMGTKSLWDAIRKELRTLQKSIGSGAVTKIQNIRIVLLKITSESDEYEPPQEAGKQGFHYVLVNVEIDHEEGD